MAYAYGDFSFIEPELMREGIKYDFDMVEKLGKEAWDAFKNHDTRKSFMYSKKFGIWSQINDNAWSGHSGASFGCSMRHIETIAKYGWEEYVKMHTSP
jgi:hypothetical protein